MSNEYKDFLNDNIKAFAHNMHKGQVRKYTNEPYINHCIRVAEIIRESSYDLRPIIDLDLLNDLINVAYLHDVVEDTPATTETIKAFFGEKIANYVDAITDVSKPEDGNREYRKMLDRNHLQNAPLSALIVKMADIMDNCSDIDKRDPSFAKKYLNEKMLVITSLDKRVDKTIENDCQRFFNLMHYKASELVKYNLLKLKKDKVWVK